MNTSRTVCLKGGLIFDGAGGAPVIGNIVFRHGRIVAWGADAPVPDEAVCVPLEGLCVSPGWVDLHTHVFGGAGIFSVKPEEIGLKCGVTTLVDAGSAGALTFEPFVRNGIQQAKERVLAYVNIASGGLLHGHPTEPGFFGEHFHSAVHSTQLAEAILRQFPREIIGWKARLTSVLADDARCDAERSAWETLLAVRGRTGLPVMVHHVDSSIPPEELMRRLQRRDVLTHLYHGLKGSIFCEGSREPIAAAREARERGVIFDVGHGCGSFRWETAEPACQQHGFWPDTISSDLHRYNLFSPVRDLATTMSKILHLGARLQEVIAMVTGNALRAIEQDFSPRRLMAPGADADLTLFRVEQGAYELVDAAGVSRMGKERIVPLAVARRGELLPCYGFHGNSAPGKAFATAIQAALAL